MNITDMLGHLLIVLLIPDIPHNEDTIKTGQNSRLEINLVRDLSEVIVLPKERISGSQNSSS
jgi:hypothetical protein